MVDFPWKVEAIKGHAGGRDKDAAALLRVETTSDTVERIRLMVEATPTLLHTLRGCADALKEAGKVFSTHAGPHASRPNLFELHEQEAREAISLATGE